MNDDAVDPKKITVMKQAGGNTPTSQETDGWIIECLEVAVFNLSAAMR
jgi:hypothetical protein